MEIDSVFDFRSLALMPLWDTVCASRFNLSEILAIVYIQCNN